MRPPAVGCHQGGPPPSSYGDKPPERGGATNGPVTSPYRASILRRGAAVVLGGLLAVGLFAAPAAARQQDPIKLKAPQTVKKAYPALVGAMPAQASGNPGNRNPAICADATYCDVIPLELNVPASLRNSDTEDYFLRLNVAWDASAQSNLSVYLYNSPYKSGDQAIATAATADNPEKMNLYRPEKAAYILLIFNASGVNNGYEVTAALTVEDFGGAPDFGGVDDPPPPSSPSSSNSADNGASFDPGPSSSASPPPASNMPFDPLPAPLAEVDQDESLSSLARRSGNFDQSLAAPMVTLQEEKGPPPEPVSGVTVALLGGLLPASLVGAGIWALRRTGGAGSVGI